MFCDLSKSDVINLIGLIVNSSIAIWIVRTLQNNLANRRYLKDHLISEVKNLRTEYKKILGELHSGKLKPKKIIPYFKLMNIKVQDIMEIIYEKYKIDKNSLKSYQVELRELVTEFEEFNSNYKENNFVELSDMSLRELINFQQNHSSKFNSLMIKINDK